MDDSKSRSKTQDAEEEKKVQLSEKRFVNVTEFRGQLYVNIREYYENESGQWRPSKKGAFLNREEWKHLLKIRKYIDQRVG